MRADLILYAIIGVLHGIADWVFARQFNPDMDTKQRVISAIKLGVLWPLYWIKALLEEFL